MSLVATNFVPLGPIKSVDMKQFVDLFTGVMTDQPVTFKNATLLGGSQSNTTAPLKLFGVVGQTSALAEWYVNSGAASPTLGITGLGIHSWSPGSPSAYDTTLSRIALQNGHVTDTPGIYITPRLEVPPNTFDAAGIIDGSITPPKLSSAVGGTIIREEFLPTNGTTTITVTQNPTGVIAVTRNGVVQSTTDGHYSTSIRVFTFSTAFDGTERVTITYAVGPFGGGLVDQSVTNVKLASDTARANLLTNGGFEIWQRGNGAFTGNVYSADRWVSAVAGTDSLSISKDNGFPDVGSVTDAICTFTLGTGAGSTALYQQLKMSENSDCLRSLTATVSMRVRVATANAVRISLSSDGTGSSTVYSTYHTGDNLYHTLSATYTVPANATFVQVAAWFAASCTAYVDNAMLVVGSVPADYAPLHPADDLARCLRYYETTAGIDTYWGNGSGLTTTNTDIIYVNQARKAIQPTLTTLLSQPTQMNIRNVGTAVAVTAVSTSQPGMSKTFLNCSVAGGLTQGSAVTAYGGSVILEANP